MGKKYYCDYCDKAYADNPTSRKNHARGVHHRQAMKAHYDFFKDAETQLREDSSKKSCRTFANTGTCQFGSACHFSHITDQRRKQLENEVRAKQEAQKRKHDPTATLADFDVNQWVAKKLKMNPESSQRTDRLSESMDTVVSMDTITVSNTAKGSIMPEYRIPEMFMNVPMLPPSLIPPTPQALMDFTPETWGP